MANKEMLELEALVSKLDEAGEDEAAIEKVFMGSVADGDELNEDDLDKVAGGLREVDIIKWLIKNTKLGKLTWQGTKICARCFYDYAKYGDPYRTYSKSYVNKKCGELEKAIPGWMKKVGEWGV